MYLPHNDDVPYASTAVNSTQYVNTGYWLRSPSVEFRGYSTQVEFEELKAKVEKLEALCEKLLKALETESWEGILDLI